MLVVSEVGVEVGERGPREREVLQEDAVREQQGRVRRQEDEQRRRERQAEQVRVELVRQVQGSEGGVRGEQPEPRQKEAAGAAEDLERRGRLLT